MRLYILRYNANGACNGIRKKQTNNIYDAVQEQPVHKNKTKEYNRTSYHNEKKSYISVLQRGQNSTAK